MIRCYLCGRFMSEADAMASTLEGCPTYSIDGPDDWIALYAHVECTKKEDN